jgi:REP element-mobilizing transposase RayT
MPRKARIDASGALQHVIVRGIERRNIFLDNTDRINFLDRLGRILKETSTPCFGWALMPNHFHLLLRTGLSPLSNVMLRILTGYAVSFNLRHQRHGHLFQNRYKSILCQEEPYLKELVRYIHLNPLRAKIVLTQRELDRYPFCGHSVIMGRYNNDWQDVNYVLNLFGSKLSEARKNYNEFVKNGIADGRRKDLVGGGLIRSAGGWSAIKAKRNSVTRIKGDERILGDTNFVEAVLGKSQESLERQTYFKSKGYDFEWLVQRVAEMFDIETKEVLRKGRYATTVSARSVLCYWAVRELGISTVALSKLLGIAQPTVSQSVRRGEKIVSEHEFEIFNF